MARYRAVYFELLDRGQLDLVKAIPQHKHFDIQKVQGYNSAKHSKVTAYLSSKMMLKKKGTIQRGYRYNNKWKTTYIFGRFMDYVERYETTLCREPKDVTINAL